MEKVALPREVAEVLTAIQQHESYPVRYVVDLFKNDLAVGDVGALKEYFESDRSRRIEIIMKALINGYEVEQTPEDKVREQYETPRHFHDKYNDTYADVYRKGMKFALDTLNIKIEGVTD